MDPWYGLGGADMLDVAHMAVHGAPMTSREAIRWTFDAVTEIPARILGLEDYGLKVGANADLVLLAGGRSDRGRAASSRPASSSCAAAGSSREPPARETALRSPDGRRRSTRLRTPRADRRSKSESGCLLLRREASQPPPRRGRLGAGERQRWRRSRRPAERRDRTFERPPAPSVRCASPIRRSKSSPLKSPSGTKSSRLSAGDLRAHVLVTEARDSRAPRSSRGSNSRRGAMSRRIRRRKPRMSSSLIAPLA